METSDADYFTHWIHTRAAETVRLQIFFIKLKSFFPIVIISCKLFQNISRLTITIALKNRWIALSFTCDNKFLKKTVLFSGNINIWLNHNQHHSIDQCHHSLKVNTSYSSPLGSYVTWAKITNQINFQARFLICCCLALWKECSSEGLAFNIFPYWYRD